MHCNISPVRLFQLALSVFIKLGATKDNFDIIPREIKIISPHHKYDNLLSHT